MCFMAVCLGPQLSKPRTQNLSKRPSNKACQNKVNTTISEAKTRIVKTYYLNSIYFCRKYTIFTKFYEFMLQKVLNFSNYAVAVLV